MAWPALVALGAFHGANPGMGWLFAVALGLQEGRTSRVLRSLLPIALGHELSVAGVAVVVEVANSVATRRLVLGVGGAVLVAFGMWRLVRRRHLRWVGMRVDDADLVLWSFVMSSAHGAGFMLLPVLGHGDEGGDLLAGSVVAGVGAAALHTGAMLVTMGVIAVTVYKVIGLDVLRRAWVNLDRVWAFALIAAGLSAVLG